MNTKGTCFLKERRKQIFIFIKCSKCTKNIPSIGEGKTLYNLQDTLSDRLNNNLDKHSRKLDPGCIKDKKKAAIVLIMYKK